MTQTISYIEIPVDLLNIISPEQAWYYSIIPKEANADYITFFHDGSKDSEDIVVQLFNILNKEVRVIESESHTIQNTLAKYYPRDKRKNSASLDDQIFEAGNSDFLVNLFRQAKNLESSDIHIEAYDGEARVRIRIDGTLVERHKIDLKDYPSLVNKIKVQANLDISEKRLPQDGRIFIRDEGEAYDVRVSIMPTFFGEKIVLRLLRSNSINVDLNSIGMTEDQLSTYMKSVQKNDGIILISGPTGSGKTTTLYSTLKVLNEIGKNIMTIEDPVEYTIKGVNQVQVKENIGLTFAKAMRSFLRQDPNVIMVGEIRDTETASMAIQASLTGHLVLSTIHTNSAWGTINRLIDMGVEPFLLADTIAATVAQRLIKKLCPNCKKEMADITSIDRDHIKYFKESQLYEPSGCNQCYFTGYVGRKAVFEIIPLTKALKEQVKLKNSDVNHILEEMNVSSIKEEVIELVNQGITSYKEAFPHLTTEY